MEISRKKRMLFVIEIFVHVILYLQNGSFPQLFVFETDKFWLVQNVITSFEPGVLWSF